MLRLSVLSAFLLVACFAWVGCSGSELTSLQGQELKGDPPPFCIPKQETCNGKDDDCDGRVDEGIRRHTCTNACGSGFISCLGGAWTSCSAGSGNTEYCDNQDNDCDGKIDENITRACSTICGAGTQTCQAGDWMFCTARIPTEEGNQADGIDNDCDGRIDEGLL